jgi:tetratricopeptide (TPR) repeat protein
MWRRFNSGCNLILQIVLFSLLSGVPAKATTLHADSARWQLANQLYHTKNYDSALQVYHALLTRHHNNAQLHYNLGNTYYRLNQVGKSILHYEKSLHLNGNNKQAKDNLQLAKNRIQSPIQDITPIFFVRWWDHLVAAVSPNTWALVLLLTFISLLALIYFGRAHRKLIPHPGRWISFNVVVFAFLSIMTWVSYLSAVDSGRAVVIVPGGAFLDAPKANGKVVGSLPEGTVIRVYTEENNFIQAKLPNGRMGWVALTTIEKV